MAATKYTYSITGDFPNAAVDTTKLVQEIQASAVVTALDYINTSGDVCDVWFKDSLSSGDETTLDGLVAAHDGEPLSDEEPKDRTNKPRVHQTSRPLGTDTYFTGCGDDPDDITDVGDGQYFNFEHVANISITNAERTSNVATITCDKDHGCSVGDLIDVDCNDNDYDATLAVITAVPASNKVSYANTGNDEDSKAATGSVVCRTHYIYLDFNIIENDTWLHEGYIIWKDAVFDRISLGIVPRVMAYEAGASTNYNLYGGYLIVPAAGDGTIDITGDYTDPNGGLVNHTYDDQGYAPTAYWNADWNESSKEFENLAAAAAGNGWFNMYGVEVMFKRFVNKFILLDSGFERIQSSDSAQLGQGMRLKAAIETVGDDHAWKVACNMTMHREKSA